MAKAPLTFQAGISRQQIRRMTRRLEEIQALVDFDVRAPNAGKVSRQVMIQFGRQAAKNLRSITPVRTGQLRRAVRYGPVKNHRDLIRYNVGFEKGAVPRFQQVLAAEFGTQYQPAKRLVERALRHAVGDGSKMAAEFVRVMTQEIDKIEAKR